MKVRSPRLLYKAMSWYSLLLLVGSDYIASGIQHLPTFVVSHPSSSTTSRLSRSTAARRRHGLAFIDNKNKEISSQKKSSSVLELSASMVSLKDGNNGRLDAEAYQDMASAAVDLTQIYARNGIVSGKFSPYVR